MSRKRTVINPVRAEHIKTLLQRENLSQAQLAKLINLTQQTISRIVQKKQALTEETARLIINAFPDYRIEWLLGFDDIMLHSDEAIMMIRNKVNTAEAINQVVRLVADDICMRENIKRPYIPFFPDFSVLQTQIHDYAELIIYDYIKNKEHSRIWNRYKTIDQEGKDNETGKR